MSKQFAAQDLLQGIKCFAERAMMGGQAPVDEFRQLG